MKLRGVVERGAGQGAFFTSLEWFRDQFYSAMGFRPFPGTLNVRICDDDLTQLDSFLAKKDYDIIPPDPQFCSGSLKKISIEGIPAAAVFPGDDVRIHPRELLEIVSDRHLKTALQLKDGDRVTITDCSE
jgi:riboflavin kinase, archaea type